MNNLFNDLNTLVETSSDWCFTSKDLTLEDKTYRIFDYHLATWSSFQAPNALNCRGTVFDITNMSAPVLVSLPPPKFFNFEEGGVDHVSDKYVANVMEKLDGSLISTYMHKNSVRLKSKGHLFSEQALAAMELLESKYPKLKAELSTLAPEYTVNFEYTAPTNMIVVFYPESSLTVLSIRRHSDGELFFGSDIAEKFSSYPEIIKNSVSFKNHSHNFELSGAQIHNFVDEVRAQTEGEGVVVQIKSKDGTQNYLTKIKNLHYISLHHAKSAIESPKRLLECIIRGQADDLRALLNNDKNLEAAVAAMEAKVAPIFNKMTTSTTDFYEQNKMLDKKSYAMKSQREMGNYFGLTIALYLGRDPKYIDFALKNRKEIFTSIDFSADKESAPSEAHVADFQFTQKKQGMKNR